MKNLVTFTICTDSSLSFADVEYLIICIKYDILIVFNYYETKKKKRKIMYFYSYLKHLVVQR